VVERLETADLVDYINFTGGDGRFHHGLHPDRKESGCRLSGR